MGILPPGFRFHPTDVELIMYYLKRKVMGKKFLFEAMAELNVYKYEPWDLAVKSLLKRDLEWYFFSPRERKYGSGARTNRATETGYWKATGKDRGIIYNNRTVGMIKTLIFYKGHAPKGERTDWVMHEYRLEDKNLADTEIIQDSFVICKIFQKSGLGPKNGAQYGAPFSEEEWNEVESAEEDGPFLTEHLKPSNHNALVAVNLAGTTASCSTTMSKVVQCPTPLAINDPCSPSEGVVSWLPICTNGAMHPVENYSTEKTNMFKSSQGAQDPITSAAFSEGLNNTQDICAIHSPVNGQVLSGHSPYSDLDNLAPLNLIIPGTTSSCPISEPGLPRLSATSNIDTNMPYDLPEDELTALLSMFTEDSRMIPFENNEDYHTVIDHSVKAQTGVDKNLIYNGLGDLNNLGELRNSDFDFSNTHNANYTLHTMLPDDDMIFLELKDLDSPLKHSVEARESLRGPSDSSYSPYTCYQNLDGSPGGSTLPKHVQNVSRLNLTSFPPEGSFWMEDLVEVSSKGPDIQNSEINGSDTLTGKKNPFQISCRQPVGSSVASQMQRRGSFHHFQ
uniref:NAC domain-containing protein n=1 Tax=Daucus carota subsp. sativus TaxID=79200 RepID=A0A165XMC0_DAUCS